MSVDHLIELIVQVYTLVLMIKFGKSEKIGLSGLLFQNIQF
jgi:hypothetical protein